ncbi:iron ABC transporter permease [Paenibacillus alkaliterrae]|uniref:FecCD family ABC transporter permease n=1 Tax=Paenibacillus alkaliterrae TaxID=320909 RepID=UPI001F1DD8C6|nr:iron ABC transporter permease [Paenibacillus alkaliterrae]MCF2938681.1 iron ABC transporter permease [Paenibacillus alkaliterrae]
MGNVLPGVIAKSLGIIIGALLLIACIYLSIALGATKVEFSDVVQSFTHYDESSNNQIIIKTSRMPRAFIAAAIGASLAIAGALIQAITRNPLADPNVLGINYGASFFIVFAITVLSVSSTSSLMWISFLGASVGAAAAYLLGSIGRDGLTPLKIILAGAALSALFSSFTQGMLVLDEQGLNDVLFWLTGSVAGRTMEMLSAVWPFMAVSWIAALLIARHINVLTMGEDAAKGLGQRTLAVKIAAGVIIGILAGCSVAIAGPIGFIGMVIPYIARFFAGIDYRWIIPYSAILGAILLLLSDIAARFIVMPEELPVGAVTAIVGIPFFIYVARRGLEKS